MTIKQTEQAVIEAGLSMDDFWHFMRGQTIGLDENGEVDVYDCDVDRFIRQKGKEDNSFTWD